MENTPVLTLTHRYLSLLENFDMPISEYDEDFEENDNPTGYPAALATRQVGQYATIEEYAAVSVLPFHYIEIMNVVSGFENCSNGT